MALNANKVQYAGGGQKFKQPTLEAGTYPARFVSIIDLGLQPQRPFEGVERPPAHQIILTYELLDVFMVDEEGKEDESKPRWISETINFNSLSSDLAKSTKRYNAMDAEHVCEGDFTKLLGTPINVTIAVDQDKKDKTKFYENVSAVTAMRSRDADKAPPLKNDVRVFDLDAPDMAVFEKLPKWIQEKLTSNLNFKGSILEEALKGKPAQADKPKEDKPVVNDEPPQEDDEDQDRPY